MKRKRFLAILMSGAMAATILGGCGSTAAPSDAGTESSANDTQASATTSTAVTESSDRPTVSFVFTKGGFEGVPDNDVIKQKIEESANITLDHIAPTSANYAEQVNLILSGDKDKMPDLIKFNASMFKELYDFADQGALMDMAPYLDNCPNIKANIPQEALDRCTIDGKLYAIPVWCSPERYNTIIRQDWLDKLGLDTPVTLDDYHDVLTAFVTQDPDGNGVNDTYGMSGIGMEAFDPIYGAYGTMAPVISYNGSLTTYWSDNGDGTISANCISDKTKAALETLHQWYDEGLIDPEFVSNTSDDDLNNKAMKNQFGLTYHWWTWEPKIEPIMQETDPDVKFTRIAPPEGENGQSAVRGVQLLNGCVVMMANADNPEACMRLLDWMNSEEGMMTCYSGVEGTHWEKKSDGTYVTLPQFDKDSSWIQWYSAFESEQPLLMVETPLVQSRRDAYQWNTITDAGDGLVTDAELEYGADVMTYAQEMITNFITGKSSLNDWDTYVQTWNDRGGAEWTKEINAKYQERNEANAH